MKVTGAVFAVLWVARSVLVTLHTTLVGVFTRKVHNDINFGFFFNKLFLAPRMTLDYNPEEEKLKYQVLLSPPDFIFGIFENFTSPRILVLAKCLKVLNFSGHFKKTFFVP